MHPFAPDAYWRWRAEGLTRPALRDSGLAATPDEHLLQQVWRHQRLRREALRTLDGHPVTVLHPGFWNREAGPDFRAAVIQVGQQPAASGDVEIDLRPAAWRQHGHDRDPAYRNVCLHVVWQTNTSPPPGLPTIALEKALDAPLDQIREWLGGDRCTAPPATQRGACAAPLRGLPPEAFADLLRQAALARLRLKAERFAARARDAGWEQSLWEGLFAALGYKHNAWPMRRLAELRTRLLADLETRPARAFELQARLLGLAGLLPDQLSGRRPAADAWLREAWDLWWRWRETVAPLVLPRSAWRFHGLRPANHPQRRLALAAHWLATPGWADRWETWLADDVPEPELLASVAAGLQPEPDSFWSRHFTLTSAPTPQPQPLLGPARMTDLAANALLPWLWSRAQAGGNARLQERVERRFLAWPAAEDNAVLRLARELLLAGRGLPRPIRAAHQQGLLQIVRDFCEHSNSLCAECRFPGLLRSAAAPAP